MDFSKQRLSIEEGRQTDMVTYLSKLGHEPAKVSGINYWYLSPLRDERTPSFKINRDMNRWYDHGLGRGGNVIDFAILYNNCTIGEFLEQLNGSSPSYAPGIKPSVTEAGTERKITILQDKVLTSFFLLRYLQQRRIPGDLAADYCREIKYELNGKTYFGIGFKNNSGGFEIRNPYFKASSSPKDITSFNNGGSDIAVFEGFSDFLSFMAIHENQTLPPTDFVVLNSVSFFEKARPILEQHARIRLYLDNDAAGQSCTRYALTLSNKYKDESRLYQHHNDLNDWLVHFGKTQKKTLGQKI